MLLRAVAIFMALIFVSLTAPVSRAQGLPLMDSGKLIRGSAVTFPPFELMDGGKPVGFDVDMVDAITTRMKVQSAPSLMDFKGLIQHCSAATSMRLSAACTSIPSARRSSISSLT